MPVAIPACPQYGTLGRAPQPLAERVRLVVLGLVLVPLKVVGTLACLLNFYVVCRLSLLLPSSVRTETVARLGYWHCRACLFCLGFVRVKWVRVRAEQLAQGVRAADANQAPPQEI